ncbi:MAG: hypothetical protein RLZZ608_1434 [Actinomycetota bacterium]|jgi:hypothetical protein
MLGLRHHRPRLRRHRDEVFLTLAPEARGLLTRSRVTRLGVSSPHLVAELDLQKAFRRRLPDL